MANQQGSSISQLQGATLPLNTTDVIPITQSGTTKKVTFDSLSKSVTQVSASLGIGMVPVNVLDITKTYNGRATINVFNNNAGTLVESKAQFQNGTSQCHVGVTGEGWATSGSFPAGAGFLHFDGTTALVIGASPNKPIYFAADASVGGYDAGITTSSFSLYKDSGSSILFNKKSNIATNIALIQASEPNSRIEFWTAATGVGSLTEQVRIVNTNSSNNQLTLTGSNGGKPTIGVTGGGGLAISTSLEIGINLLVDGVGPHAVGAGVSASSQWRQAGSFTTGGADAYGFVMGSTLTNASSGNGYGVYISPAMVGVGSAGTDFTSLYVDPPSMSGTAPTNATTLKISGPPSAGTNKRSLWVVSGNICFGSLPTSSAGLPSGTIWSNSNVLTVVP